MKSIEMIGMHVITPLGRTAVVLSVSNGGKGDMFERVICQYTDVDTEKDANGNRVTLQPHLLRAK